jgi:hypothetical protein
MHFEKEESHLDSLAFLLRIWCATPGVRNANVELELPDREKTLRANPFADETRKVDCYSRDWTMPR